jgi:hypothetical protein
LAKRILNNRCGKEEGEANISLLWKLFRLLSSSKGFTTTMEDVCIAYGRVEAMLRWMITKMATCADITLPISTPATTRCT